MDKTEVQLSPAPVSLDIIPTLYDMQSFDKDKSTINRNCFSNSNHNSPLNRFSPNDSVVMKSDINDDDDESPSYSNSIIR